MTYYSLTALINCLGSAVIAIFVLGKAKNNPIAKVFVFLLLTVIVWSASYFLWQVSASAEAALFWCKALMFGAIFISLLYLHFILAFLKLTQQKKRFLQLSYLLFLVFFVANFNNLMVVGVEENAFFHYWPKPGLFFHPFLLLWFVYAIYGLHLLIKAAKENTGLVRLQAKYLIVGMLMGYGGGITNYFLWYNIQIPPVGNGLIIFNLAIIGYTILRHRFLNIKVVYTEILVGLISLVLLINLFLSETGQALFLNLIVFAAALLGGIALIKSVTTEINTKERLQQAYDELKQLDEAKSEFISIASHQLRTPLSAVKGYISLLLENTYGALEERAKTPLKNVYQANERLIAIVNHLLNISRIDGHRIKPELEKTSLEKIIDDLIETMKIKAREKGLYLKLEKPETEIPIMLLDKEKISQAILNLIDNAIHYTKEGGVTISLQKQLDHVVIQVKDTGVGLDQEDLAHAFKSFSRGKQGSLLWTEGAGLGLYVAKKFVEIHRGKIWAKSKGKNKGSTFFIKLPLK